MTLVTDETAAFSQEMMHAAKLNGQTSAHAILATAELISTLQAGPTAAD